MSSLTEKNTSPTTSSTAEVSAPSWSFPGPQVVYKERSDQIGDNGAHSFDINSSAAFDSIIAASRVFGFSHLAGVLEARKEGVKDGFLEKRHFKEQGALALRWVLEGGARQHEGVLIDPLEPMLPPELAERIYELHQVADPRRANPTTLEEEMAKLSPRPNAPIDMGPGYSDEAYTAFHETDPKTMAVKPLAHV